MYSAYCSAKTDHKRGPRHYELTVLISILCSKTKNLQLQNFLSWGHCSPPCAKIVSTLNNIIVWFQCENQILQMILFYLCLEKNLDLMSKFAHTYFQQIWNYVSTSLFVLITSNNYSYVSISSVKFILDSQLSKNKSSVIA